MQSNLIVDISDVHTVKDDVAEMLLHHTSKNVERNVRPATWKTQYKKPALKDKFENFTYLPVPARAKQINA